MPNLSALCGRVMASFCLVMTLAAQCAHAIDYFVAPTGTLGAPGTINAPFLRIQSAVDIAQAGDTIFLRQGTYNESFTFRRSGVAGRPITLKNYLDEHVVIDPHGGYDTPGRDILLQAKEGYQFPIGWIVIEGLEIQNNYNGIKLYNAHDVIIRKNFIHDSGRQGILGNGYKVLIEQNTITRTARTGAPAASNQCHGIYLTGTYNTIINNIFHSNLGYGLQIAAYPLNYPGMGYSGPEYSDAHHWLVSNNTFAYQQNRGGIVVWQSGASDNVIQNNIFFDNSVTDLYSANGVEFSEAGPRNILKNNLYYSPSGKTPNGGVSPSTVSLDTGQLLANPKFPTAYDFSLIAGSPAVDAGIDDLRVQNDITGKQRPTGAHSDIGAYEYLPNARPKAPANLRTVP